MTDIKLVLHKSPEGYRAIGGMLSAGTRSGFIDYSTARGPVIGQTPQECRHKLDQVNAACAPLGIHFAILLWDD